MKKLLNLLFLVPLFVACSSSDDNNDSVQVNITSIAIEAVGKDLYVGDEYQLSARHSPEDVRNLNYRWTSSNTEIATVSDKGVLTAKAEGDVTISASYAEISTSVNLKIHNTLFGFKFGSSMEEINPDIKISNDFAYNWSSPNGYEPPLRAFKFQQNKLASVWSCYESYTGRPAVYFLDEVKSLNPPVEVTLVNKQVSGSVMSLLEQDSLSWKHNDQNILIRNGFIPIRGNSFPMLIIEYSQAN